MTRLKQNRSKITLWFQDDILAAMRRISEAKGTTYSELIREACREYVIARGPEVAAARQTIRQVTGE